MNCAWEKCHPTACPKTGLPLHFAVESAHQLLRSPASKETAEKGVISIQVSEKYPSGAESRVDFAALTARDPEGAPVVPRYKAAF
jgi:hypothetical protein